MTGVIKANGETEPFDENKIRRSLERSGAEPGIVDMVIKETRKKLYSNISTGKLYRIVFNELRRLQRPAAGRYHLKRAIMELGPTGFPFEKFISELFVADGYQTSTDRVIEGYCVRHEVDVIAENQKEQFMMECKYHSEPGVVCDVKHALYVRARFQDIEKKLRAQQGQDMKPFKGWLVTNTRMTLDAEKYGICSGLEMMSWNFPAGKSLRERIDDNGLHPVTCITLLTRSEKQQLLNKQIVLCRTLCANPAVLKDIGINDMRANKIIEEGRHICKPPKDKL